MNPRVIRRVALWSAALAWLGCAGGDGAGVDLPALQVRTVTSGVQLDPDGYTVVVDGGAGRSIGINATLEIGSLPDGAHTVQLRDVADNCVVQGEQPRAILTTTGGTTEVTFEVECRAGLGSVRVITSTTGSDLDEDGYVVVVAGEARQVEVNGSVTFAGVPSGEVVVEILGVTANCTASTQTYYEVTVTSGDTHDVTFAFDCAPRQPDTGTLQVAAATTGPAPDADGYVVAVDGGSGNPIPASGTVLLPGLPIGSRSVALSGIAANCAVSGENPRSVTVTGTELAAVSFAVICAEPPPATGSLRVTTSTTGTDFDPTGYRLRIDGNAGQPLGVNSTTRIDGLASGSHSIALDDLTPNCQAADNPRTLIISSDAEAAVTFAVTCIPAFGYITTTTRTSGAAPDPDGYVARVDGGAGKPVAPNGAATRGGLPPGPHTVQLDNVAANCQVQGDNPRAVVVAGYETTTVAFEILCAATTGSLTLAVTGVPAGASADVTVSGPEGFARPVTGPATLDGLAPGQYTVTAAPITVNGLVYEPSAEVQEVTVASGESVAVDVSYSSTPGGTLNLRIAGLYVTQGSQTPQGDVPLVEGRDGFLRVFVLANGDNQARPAVRIRLFQNGNPLQTLEVQAPGATTPTVRQEQSLETSWNIRIPGGLVRRGLAILAEVDPGNSIAESDETDNVYSVGGSPVSLVVRPASAFRVTLIPVRLGPGGLTGDLTSSNVGRYLAMTERMFPLSEIDAALHPMFVSSLGPAEAGGTNAALSSALAELRMLRVVEGSNRTYYGVTHSTYSSGGIAGLGYLGYPAALGWDQASEAGSTAAHEFGHTWNRLHAPCGGPLNVDPDFPYVGAAIGQYGFDMATSQLIDPITRDLMSYCRPRWVSDYTYVGVMAFRESFQDGLEAHAAEATTQPSLIVWGRIEHGRPVLEPSFLVYTRPSLPARPGPYRIKAVGRDGRQAFGLSFEATPVADGPQGLEHFAFAIPIDSSIAAELQTIRLDGPAGIAELSVLAGARTHVPSPPPPQAHRTSAGVLLEWDRGSALVALVRDASTGEVLAVARGGSVEVPTRASELEVYLSNGPSSRLVRIPINR